MGKSKKVFLLFLIVILSTFILVSCGEPSHIPSRDVTKNHILFYDGENIVAKIFKYDSESKVLPKAPYKDGLSFEGWYYKNDGAQFSKPFTADDLDKEINGMTLNCPSIEIEAKYGLGKFVVTFDGHYKDAFSDGEGNTSRFAFYEYDRNIPFESIVTPTNPSHSICTFEGWYKDETLLTPFTDEDKLVAPLESYTLYSKWHVPSFTITFDPETAPGLEPITQEYESAITLPKPTKENNLFAYFYYLVDGVENKFTYETMPGADYTLYAKWVTVATINYYHGDKLLYSENNHPIENPINLMDATVGTDLYEPDYVFEGWYKEKELNNIAKNGFFTANPVVNLYGKYNQRGGLEVFNIYDHSEKVNPVLINSMQDMVDIIDYSLTFNQPVYFKLNYIVHTNANVQKIIDDAYKQMTCVNNPFSWEFYSNSACIIPQSIPIDTKTPYQTFVEQKQPGLVPVPTKKRAKTFDDFKYKDYPEFSKEIVTSDQLFYVLQKGYKPICIKDTAADKMLNKAKTILRDIIDDSMSDFDKLYAIYCWLIVNVNYDKKAVELSKGNEKYSTKCYAWHLEGVFNDHIAVCDGISKALTVLARIEGLNVIRVTGPGHAWNKVYLDVDGNGAENAKWYSLDATWDDLLIVDSAEIPIYTIPTVNYFLIADSDKKQGDKLLSCENYLDKDLVANETANVYKYITFNNGADNLVIKHVDDMQALINHVSKYMKQNSLNKTYVEIEYLNVTDVSNLIGLCDKAGLIITRVGNFGNKITQMHLEFKRIA